MKRRDYSASARTGGGRSVEQLVGEVRRRWRRSVLIRGGALSVMVALLLLTVLLIAVTAFEIQRGAFLGAVGIALLISAGVAFVFVVRPLLRQPDDRRLALFVEERVPALQDRLNSAVEVGARAGRGNNVDTLVEQLVRDAVHHARDIQPATVVDQQRERIFGSIAVALFAAFLIFGYRVRDKIQITRSGVQVVGVAFAQPEVTVLPGNAEVERGASQEFIVSLRDDVELVELVTRATDGSWTRHTMLRGIEDAPTYLFELADIQEPLEYYVQYGTDRTAVYSLSLYEFPSVDRIAVTYRYPEYTGLANKTEDGAGDLEGVVGTRAFVRVQTGGVPTQGKIVFGDGSSAPLTIGDDGRFAGSVDIRSDGSYHIELTDDAGKQNRFPVEYAIIAIDDLAPVVTITEPQRDLRVNAIQEVLLAAEAYDDFGVTDLQLHFTVNDAEEQTIELATAGGDGTPDVTGDLKGEYLMFLEDYTLEPGDVISYYASARDRRPGAEPAYTDMYFVEVIPFDQQFTQVNNTGGGGGGGQRQGGIVLSQQEIIAATWRLLREQSLMTDGEVREMRDGIVQAQENLKADIEERISNTAFSRELLEDDASREIVGHLREAVSDMDDAVEVLTSGDLRRALTPERSALNHLLKADAMNSEQQVTMNRGQQGGGGGGGSVQERISELMDLELDISKDKYETQQQRSEQQRQQSVDDALDRIKELARRQQALAEEGRQPRTEEEEERRFIDRLKREQDELRRQMDEVSRSMSQSQSQSDGQSSSQSGAAARQAGRRISDEMNRAEEALNRGDVEEAMVHQQRALNELQRLQQDLQVSSNDGTRNRVADVGRAFDELRKREEQLDSDITEEIQRLREEGRNPSRAQDRDVLEGLQDQRAANQEALQRLSDQIEELEADVRSEDPSVASALRNMLQRMRREELSENMTNSREALRQGWLDYAERTQDEIQETMGRMEPQRRALDEMMPPSDEERVARALRDAQELQDALDAMQRQAAGERGQEGQEGQEGQQGQQGSDASGQGAQGDRAERAGRARLDAERRRALDALQRLRQGMQGGDAQARAQLDRLESFLTRADGTGVLLEGEAAAAFFNREAYDPLSQLEMTLMRQMDEIDLDKKLYGARPDDVPPEYRRMVDDYYEALSKDNN